MSFPRAVFLTLVVAGCDHSFVHDIPNAKPPTESTGTVECDEVRPSGLAVTAVTPTEIVLTWDAPTDEPDGYQIDRMSTRETWAPVDDNIPPTTRELTDTFIENNELYTYRVLGFTANCHATAATETAEVASYPLPPTDFSVAASTTGSITVGWTDDNDHEAGYRVEYRLQGDAGAYAVAPSTAPDVETITIDSLDADSPYEILVYAVRGGSTDDLSITAGTTSGWTLPHAPENFRVTARTGTSIQLAWNPGHSSSTEFVLQRAPVSSGTWGAEVNLGAEITTHTDNSVVADTGYNYQLKAQNPGGDSDWVVRPNVFTLAGGINDLTATTVSTTAIDLTWIDDSTTETGFRIERREAGSASYTTIHTTAADAELYQDTVLTPDTEYEYQVWVESAAGDAHAGDASGWTLPWAPTGVAVTTLSPTDLRVDWNDTNTHEIEYLVRRDGLVEANVAPDVETYTDTERDPDTTYTYEVGAQNPGGITWSGSVADRTSRHPVLSWDGVPTLAFNCLLSAPGTTTFDTAKSATLDSATGSISPDWGAVTADETGVELTIAGYDLGPFTLSWSVTDSLGGTAALIDRALTLAIGTVNLTTTAAPLPAGDVGEDSMTGRQPWRTTVEPTQDCGNHCTGRRGSIGLGVEHSCVITDAGGAKCWGVAGGALGSGPDPADLFRTHEERLPVDVCASGWVGDATCVPFTGGVAALSAAERHTCAIMDSGELYCWGRDQSGLLGSGSTGAAYNPVPVCIAGSGCTPITDVVSVSAGWEHSCAVRSDGSAYCWGYSGPTTLLGRLGDGIDGNQPSSHSRDEATSVCATGSHADSSCVPLTGVVEVAAGSIHTCALMDDGDVVCWGASNSFGLLGNGQTGNFVDANPVDVMCNVLSGAECPDGNALTGAVAISTRGVDSPGNSGHTCALLSSGSILCWGNNGQGQLGDGSFTTRLNPVPVCATGVVGVDCTPLTGVVAIAAAARATCALLNDGHIRCWGDQPLGDPEIASNAPNPIEPCLTGGSVTGDCVPIADAIAIAAGEEHFCALRDDSELRCWGVNFSGSLGGRLGTGGMDDRPFPDLVCNSGTGAGPDCTDGAPFTETGFRRCGALEVTEP